MYSLCLAVKGLSNFITEQLSMSTITTTKNLNYLTNYDFPPTALSSSVI